MGTQLTFWAAKPETSASAFFEGYPIQRQDALAVQRVGPA